MRSAFTPLFIAALLVAACDESEDEFGTDSSTNMVGAMPGLAGGNEAGPPGTAGGPGGTTGGVVGLPGSTTGGPGSTGGVPDASVVLPGGGVSGAGDSGVGAALDGGTGITGGTQGGTGGGDAGSSGPGPSVSGPGPVIPKVNGQCPVFQSGVTMIHGLSVNVYAGPKTAGKKGPLVFHWHGTGGKGDNVEKNPFGDGDEGAGIPAEVRAEILAEGGIIISPTADDSVREGTDVTFILGVWYTPGDLELADLVTACAVEQQLIDPRRIYTTGCSAGGLMAGVMTFHRSSYLAASVPNSGGVVDIPGFGMTTFQDAHVPALMTMHGEADEVIVNFKDTSRDADNAAAAKGGFVVNCNHGGGHCGAPTPLKVAMWQFMKDHPFGVSPEPYANGLPASFPSYCKIVKP